jgi:hypothetical protein
VQIGKYMFCAHGDQRLLSLKSEKEDMVKDLLLKCFGAPSWHEVAFGSPIFKLVVYELCQLLSG